MSTLAAVPEHIVTSLPGFPESAFDGFKVYSGMLNVTYPKVNLGGVS